MSRRTVLRLATGVAAGLFVGEVAYGGFYERHHLGVTRADVPCAALPPSLDGLRIGLITDTHHSAFTALPFIDRAVRLVRDEAPRPGGARRRLRDAPQSPLHHRRRHAIRAPSPAPRRVRGAGQPRRRRWRASGAAPGRRHGARRRANAPLGPWRDRGPAGAGLLDAKPDRGGARGARTGAVHDHDRPRSAAAARGVCPGRAAGPVGPHARRAGRAARAGSHRGTEVPRGARHRA